MGTGSSSSISGSTIRESALTSAVTGAINRAIRANLSSANAVLRNIHKVPVAVLKNASKNSASSAGGGIVPKVSFDTVRGGAVIGRVTFDLTKVANISSDISLGVSTTNRTVSKTFSRYFKNETALVDLAHKAAFGTEVEIAAKVDLGKLDTSKLVFYCYDQASNTYFQLRQPKYFIDANGYVHFVTHMGGSVIITDSALALK